MNNSFKLLDEKYVRSFREAEKEEQLRERLEKSLMGLRFIGSIAEIYFSLFADTLTCMTGASKSDPEPNRSYEEKPRTDVSRPGGPSSPDNDPIR